MSHPNDPPALSKAERLAIGAAVAAPVRQQAKAPRKVTLVDKDGKPVGVTTSTEVATNLLRRSEIEFSVQPGKRPEFVNCKTCGRPVKVPRFGTLPKTCRAGTHRCACGELLKGPGCRLGRSCEQCARRENAEKLRAMPKEQRELLAKQVRERWMTLTPEQRSEKARAATAGLTPEQRASNARKGQACMLESTTEEQRVKNAKKASAAARAASTPEREQHRIDRLRDAMTPEQRRANGVRGGEASLAVYTREQRSVVAKRVNAERAAKRLRESAATTSDSKQCSFSSDSAPPTDAASKAG